MRERYAVPKLVDKQDVTGHRTVPSGRGRPGSVRWIGSLRYAARMIAALLVAVGLGTALLVLGVRGRRIDDHRLCRKCGFDLTGKPDESRLCPECGADVTISKGVRVGNRKPRSGLLWASVAMLVPAAVVGTLVVWGIATGVQWLHYAPVSYLMKQASSGDSARRTPSLLELKTRYDHARLAGSSWDRVADAGLAYQGDLSKPWDTAWGNLLERARADGRLSDDRWKRYARQACADVVTLVLRPVARRGDAVPFTLVEQTPRVAAMSALTVSIQNCLVTPVSATMSKDVGMDIYSIGSGSSCGSTMAVTAFPASVPTGQQQVHATGRVRVSVRGSVGKTFLADEPLDLPGSFVLNAADRPSVQLVADPSKAEAIRAAMKFTPPTPGGNNAMVYVNGTPVGLSFGIFVRDKSRHETRESSIACPAGTTNHGYGIYTPGWPVGEAVEVIFRADPSAAAATVDTTTAWDGQIVIRVGE